MTRLLQINTSLFSGQGQSSQLAERFVSAYLARNPDTQVRTRDLAADPVPHLDGERFTAFTTPAEQRTDAQRAVVAYSDALIEELRVADVIVLGLPMYNFHIPSQLKSYFDHVARIGVTFSYTPQGPVGLLTGKKAYVLEARGGNYVGTHWDTETAYVRNFLAFIGITDVEFVHAEGLARGEESRVASLTNAHSSIDRLAA